MAETDALFVAEEGGKESHLAPPAHRESAVPAAGPRAAGARLEDGDVDRRFAQLQLDRRPQADVAAADYRDVGLSGSGQGGRVGRVAGDVLEPPGKMAGAGSDSRKPVTGPTIHPTLSSPPGPGRGGSGSEAGQTPAVDDLVLPVGDHLVLLAAVAGGHRVFLPVLAVQCVDPLAAEQAALRSLVLSFLPRIRTSLYLVPSRLSTSPSIFICWLQLPVTWRA